MTEDRYDRGWDKLLSIHAEVGEQSLAKFEQVSPDLARYIIEFAYGDIWNRPGLDLKSRSIATVASLITSGNATSELKAHINGALNVGCSRQEIMEIIIHLAVYTGFPSAINAMFAAQEVFAKRDKNGES